MHAHGLRYDKGSEGALYKDGVDPANKRGSFVPSGGTYTYTWFVPERAGPGGEEGSSVLWMYYGHFMEAKDVNTGLIGPILVNARGTSNPMGLRSTLAGSSSWPSRSSTNPTVGTSKRI